jgi:isoleucyl-tRNA synthetase
MRVARAVVALGRKLREDHRVKVRQPLARLTVVHRDPRLRSEVLRAAELVKDELNVKDVAVEADEHAFASVTVKPNFKTLGKRCGPKLKDITAALKDWGPVEVSRVEAGESIEVVGEAIALGDVLLQRSARKDAAIATDGEITVALDTRIDDALRREGVAREFVSLMQNERKEADLEVTDRIEVTWRCADEEVAAALREHRESIAREILAERFDEGEASKAVSVNGVPVQIELNKQA